MNIATGLYLFFGVLGLALFVAGTFVQLGLGWALISGAASAFAIAAFIRKGLTSE
ncbi:hypothetical protein MMZ74_31020 (plasmid) [Pseudomonas aeruginosa]|uniref:hypothetical protein n=1 Tax=Pseudomonas aeruginosa TaxID=287 RepID=UPI001F4E5B86|nr:hypothetical protein [Pseudomonas aeruginosa]UTP65333.1 hypothetical protein MMZ74_31020 [Pseudomonas aeruginosa]